MKKNFLLVLFLVVQFSYCSALFSYKLNKNEKLEGNFSIVVNTKETCHFLFIKNTDSKKYIIKSYLMSSDRTIKQLEDVLLDVEPNFLTNHTNNNILTVSSYDEKKKLLTVIDFNMTTGKSNSENFTDFKKPDLYFNEDNKSVLVNLGKNDVSAEVITNTKSTNRKIYTIPDSIIKEYKDIKNASLPIEGINQSEFVKNGSINKFRAYISEKNLYFTTTKNDSQTSVLKFDLNSTTVKSQSIDYNFNASYMSRNTFVSNDNLYVVSSSESDVVIKSFNLKDNNENAKLSVVADLTDIINKTSIQDFLSQSKLSSLITTVTLNQTTDNLYKVRIDRVNKNSYKYNYNWWWQHQFMMMQMQMMQMQQIRTPTMGRAGGFGPNADINENILFILGKEKEYNKLEFVVDANFVPQKNATSETKFKNFNVDELIKEFEDNSRIKKFAPAFLSDEMRYVYQDNKTKEIIIDFKKI